LPFLSLSPLVLVSYLVVLIVVLTGMSSTSLVELTGAA